jgi:transcriptional regulator with XRE-family HTH domain
MTTQSDDEPGDVLVWTLGDRLAKARKMRGMKQEQLAAKLRLSRHSIMRYENDDGTPPLTTIIAWSVVCKVKLSELLGDEDGGAPVTMGDPYFGGICGRLVPSWPLSSADLDPIDAWRADRLIPGAA